MASHWLSPPVWVDARVADDRATDVGDAPRSCRPGISWEACVAADHYRLPRPVGPSPGIELGASRPSTAEAVRAALLARARSGWVEMLALVAVWFVALGIRLPHLWSVPALGDETSDLLHALTRAQAGAWLVPGAVGSSGSSVGALHELLFASVFALVGPSP